EYDSYADSIESMLYLLPWFNIPECHYWVDNEIGVLFHLQLKLGLAKYYLDGNFIRTALLYAGYKTQGVLVEPWQKNVCLGAAFDQINNKLYLCLHANTFWRGILRFDQKRHYTILNLPFNYPRLNANPEWFTVDPQKNYSIIDLQTGKKTTYSGASLIQGLPVAIRGKGKYLWIRASEDK
ncbi:MAG: hypothetical protein N3A64_01265, partial [Desulfobacterota bacterium]|nr:hypothetical protein [Thermodesulfobacteriota bacterium]